MPMSFNVVVIVQHANVITQPCLLPAGDSTYSRYSEPLALITILLLLVPDDKSLPGSCLQCGAYSNRHLR